MTLVDEVLGKHTGFSIQGARHALTAFSVLGEALKERRKLQEEVQSLQASLAAAESKLITALKKEEPAVESQS